mmetsp:Transcript_38615/g.46734  ORF Transcript_38615/g.46734 Transcript_38615/m.46734 type:complete len:509 (-) Transcript_38615:441-1967(-)
MNELFASLAAMNGGMPGGMPAGVPGGPPTGASPGGGPTKGEYLGGGDGLPQAMAEMAGQLPGGKLPEGFDQEAEEFWKYLDELSKNPDAYQKFIQKQTEEYAKSQQGKQQDKDAKTGNKSKGKAPEKQKATFLITSSKRSVKSNGKASDVSTDVVVSIWRPERHSVKLAPPPPPADGLPKHAMDCRQRAPPYEEADLALIGIPSEMTPIKGISGAPKAIVFSLDMHDEAITRALDDQPFRSHCIESAFMWIEANYKVALSREKRKMYTYRNEAPQTAQAAAAAKAAVPEGSAAGDMSSGLLQQIASMAGTQQPRQKGKKQQPKSAKDRAINSLLSNPDPENQTNTNKARETNQSAANQGGPPQVHIGKAAPSDSGSGPLIKEISTTRVKTDPPKALKETPTPPAASNPPPSSSSAAARGANAPPKYSLTTVDATDEVPASIEVVVEVPHLQSMGQVDLEVGALEVALGATGDVGPLLVQLPFQIDQDAVRAKFEKKTRRLRIRAPALP